MSMYVENKKRKILYYRECAERYERSDVECANSIDRKIINDWLLQKLEVYKPKVVLDLGCGTGRYFHVITIKKDAELIGIDITKEMLIKALNKKAGAHLVLADAFYLPLKDHTVDLCFSIGILGEHVPLVEDIYKEIRRVLKRGGAFVYTALHPSQVSSLGKLACSLELKNRIMKRALRTISRVFRVNRRFYATERSIIKLSNLFGLLIKELNIPHTAYKHYFITSERS